MSKKKQFMKTNANSVDNLPV